MIQSTMSWQPKLRPKGFPHGIDDFVAVASLSELEHRARTGEDKRDQRVFRVKRKHVLKACDRCRVKKTKCDGKQPCNRCSVYNHPCLFRERKATQTKVYSRGFVEMLESHHSLVVKALQKLYKFCINKEGFPGDPLVEAPDGHPLTHAILDRLGLIKQAEENADEPEEDSEDLRYLRLLSTSTECSVTAEPSPEPATPPEPSPTLSRPPCSIPTPVSVSSRTATSTSWQWDLQPVHQTSYSYPDAGYHDLMALQQRSSMTAPDMGTDIAPHVDLPSAPSALSHHQHAHHEPSFPYVLDGCCPNPQQDVKPVLARLQPGIMAESHTNPHHLAGSLPTDMMGDFQFQTHDSAFYPGFTPGWNFPQG
ncbi:Fluconazole resistance protein [Penicillium chrysogenum]|nr:Fluconazole resistance protein [Penicillium chrysogenum]